MWRWLIMFCTAFASVSVASAGAVAGAGPAESLQAWPGSAIYERFESVGDPVPAELHPLDLPMPGLFRLVEATVAWTRRTALEGPIQLDALHRGIAAHRRRLAESSYLIDKTTFTATGAGL